MARSAAFTSQAASSPGVGDCLFVVPALLLSLPVYVGLGFWLARGLDATPKDSQLFLPEFRPELLPEPGEKRCYLLGLLCIVALPAAFYWFLVQWNRRRPRHFAWMAGSGVQLVGHLLVIAGVVAWLGVLSLYSEISQKYSNHYLLVGAGLTLLLPLWTRLFWFCESRFSAIARVAFPVLAVGLILLAARFAVLINEDVSVAE